jgi:hypothetical protein
MTDTDQQQVEPCWVGASPAIIAETGGQSDDTIINNETTYNGAAAPTSTTTAQQDDSTTDEVEEGGITSAAGAAAYLFGKETMLSLEMSAVTASLAATTDLALDAAADCDAVLDLQESFVSCIEGVKLQHDYDLDQDNTRDYYPTANPNPVHCSTATENYNNNDHQNTNHSPTSATETTCFLTSNEAAALILLQTMEQAKSNDGDDDDDDDDAANSNHVIHRPFVNNTPPPISLRDLDILNICSSIDSGDEVMMEQLLPAVFSAAVATNVEQTTTAAAATAATPPSPPSTATVVSRTTNSLSVAASLSDILVPESSSVSSTSVTSQNNTSEKQPDAFVGATYDGMSSFCVSADETATAGSSKPTTNLGDNEQEAGRELGLQPEANDKPQPQESSSSVSQVPLYHDQTTTPDMTGCVIL